MSIRSMLVLVPGCVHHPHFSLLGELLLYNMLFCAGNLRSQDSAPQGHINQCKVKTKQVMLGVFITTTTTTPPPTPPQ